MWKAGNVINRIGNIPPAVMIFDPQTDSDIGEARTIEAARMMAAAPVMVQALRDAVEYAERGKIRGRAVMSQEAMNHFSRAIALATGNPTGETESPTRDTEGGE